jgi:hypothetical protein
VGYYDNANTAQLRINTNVMTLLNYEFAIHSLAITLDPLVIACLRPETQSSLSLMQCYSHPPGSAPALDARTSELQLIVSTVYAAKMRLIDMDPPCMLKKLTREERPR